MQQTIFLDYASTTPVDPEVLDAMLPWLREGYGNPSSVHSLGRTARTALDDARDAIARLIHCDYSEICFTGSGTEADNQALLGAMTAAPPHRNRLVTTSI